MQFLKIFITADSSWITSLFSPDPNPSHHFYYLLFIPSAIAGCFLLAALVSRYLLPRKRPLIARLFYFLLSGSLFSLVLMYGLWHWQQQLDTTTGTTTGTQSSKSSDLSPGSTAFTQAFCIDAMDQARSALTLATPSGIQTAISDCLTAYSNDGLKKVLLKAKVPLLIDAIATLPHEQQQPSVEKLLKQLYAYRDYDDIHRLQDMGFSVHATNRDVSPNQPLWWLVSLWDGQPPTSEDLRQLEALGIDLRERDALGTQFIFAAGLLHEISTPALAHLVDVGIDRNAIGHPRAITVEAMYRRFGWNQITGTERDLAHLLKAVGEPSSEELRREAANPNFDPRVIGPASIDHSQIQAFHQYLTRHGLDASESPDQAGQARPQRQTPL